MVLPAPANQTPVPSSSGPTSPTASTSATSGCSGNKFGEANLFPQVLYHVLNECTDKEFVETGIRWTHDGLQIQIGRAQFVANTLGKYFNTTKYNSFTRNLNLYGFKKCKIYSGIYSHPDYRRDNFSLIKNMRRPKVGTNKGEKRGRPSQASPQPSGKKQKSDHNVSCSNENNSVQISLPKKQPPSRPNLKDDTLLSPPTPQFHANQSIMSPSGSFHEKSYTDAVDRKNGSSPDNVMDIELSMEDAAFLLSSICRHPSLSFSSGNEQSVQ